MTEKIAPAKEWMNRHIDDWNTVSFTEYMKDKHKKLFGIDYVPFANNWQMEQGMIGDLIGTQSKKNPKSRKASNKTVKRFIDYTFDNYQPNSKYPGTSFGYMFTYKKIEWQQIQAEELSNKKEEVQRQRAKETVEDDESFDELIDWL